MSDQEKGMSLQEAKQHLAKYNQERHTNFGIDKKLGAGTLGTVFGLKHAGAPLVVKIALDNGEAVCKELCMNEIEIMQLLRGNPHIMPLMDALIIASPIGYHGGGTQIWGSVYYLIMPQMTALSASAEGKEGWTEEEVVQIAKDICSALQHCEDNSVLHLDVKPGNLFTDDYSEKRKYVLGDFNVSMHLTEKDWKYFIPNGFTESFAAPEILAYNPKHKNYRKLYVHKGSFNSDIFSLGASLYYLLSEKNTVPGIPYMKGNAPRTLRVSAALEDIIMKAVRYDPDNRYQHASEMLRDLESLEPTHETVMLNKRSMWAKEALLNNKLDKAMHHAQRGADGGDPDCIRLLAYCRYKAARMERASIGEAEYRRRIRALQESFMDMYMEYEDPIALFLSAIISLECADEARFCNNVRQAADGGCILAKFMHGRFLMEGRHGHPFNEELGRKYVIEAALAFHKPAVRYIGKYMLNKRHRPYIPADLLQCVEEFDITNYRPSYDETVEFL